MLHFQLNILTNVTVPKEVIYFWSTSKLFQFTPATLIIRKNLTLLLFLRIHIDTFGLVRTLRSITHYNWIRMDLIIYLRARRFLQISLVCPLKCRIWILIVWHSNPPPWAERPAERLCVAHLYGDQGRVWPWRDAQNCTPRNYLKSICEE